MSADETLKVTASKSKIAYFLNSPGAQAARLYYSHPKLTKEIYLVR